METLDARTLQQLVAAARDDSNPLRAEQSQGLILRYADEIDAGVLTIDEATRALLSGYLARG